MVVPHGPGHLLVLGPGDDYLHVATSYGEMGVGIRPSFRMYPDAHASLDIKDGEATHPLELRLRRGVTVTGRVVGPDGKPVAEAFAFGRSYTPYREYTFPLVGFNGEPAADRGEGRPVRDPRLRPGEAGHVLLPRPQGPARGDRGALGQVGGGRAGHGAAPAHGDGPLPPEGRRRQAARQSRGGDWSIDLQLVITPGPDFGELNKNIDLTPGDFAYQVDLDPARNRGLRSGPDGRVTMVNLIPGARYRFRGREFTPEPGQTVDLGDVVVAKPAG